MTSNKPTSTNDATVNATAAAARALPEGFHGEDAVQMTERVDTLDKGYLVDGAVVRYVRTDKWQASGEDFVMHVFMGKRLFGVWGAAQLDAKLERIAPNTELFLRYDGKGQHPTVPTRQVHNWTVVPKRVQTPAAPVTGPAVMGQDELPF